jgi:hypothetical protein
MSEPANTKNVDNDEIDLLDLFRRMGRTLTRWANALGRGILISIVFLLRHWLPLGTSVVLGVGVAFLLKYTTPSSYTSDLVLRTNGAPTADLISYINRLHKFCKEKNMNALGEAISINTEKAKNIADISAFWIIDKGRDGIPDFVDYNDTHDVYDTVNVRMPDRLDIRVKINIPQELNPISVGIIKYINSDSLFRQMNKVRLRQNNEMLERMNYDILQLDSLQKFKYFEETKNMHPKNGGQMIFLQEHNTQLVYDNIHELYVRKQALESERDLYNDITTILSNFSIPSRRVNGGTFYAIRVVPVFFIITLLFLIIFANRKRLKELYKKY